MKTIFSTTPYISKVVLALMLTVNVTHAQVITTTQADIDPNVTSNSCVLISSNLGQGASSRNGDVGKVQDFLIDNGYLNSESTGYFGSMTKKAVIAYQTKKGFTATGYVGVLTRTAIAKDTGCAEVVIAKINAATITKASSQPPKPVKSISQASSTIVEPDEIYCTDEIRMCPDGTIMPRGPKCSWRPEKCGVISTNPSTASTTKPTKYPPVSDDASRSNPMPHSMDHMGH